MSAVSIHDGRPVDEAQIALWRPNVASPIAFKVEEREGRRVLEQWKIYLRTGDASATLHFSTYADGSGRRSESWFQCDELCGVTLEYATIAIAGRT